MSRRRMSGWHDMLGSSKPMVATVACMTCLSGLVRAEEPVKIGLVLPMTGAFASAGRQVEAGVKLYMAQHGSTAAGRTVQLIVKDDTGVPDTAKRIAQDLIVNDHVAVIAGMGLTPIAMAIAPLATRAKVPEVVMVAATSSVTAASPYIVRTSVSMPQTATIIADWAARNGVKKIVTITSDYGPGIDAEKWFKEPFTAAGGEVPASVRIPLDGPDFSPFLQKVADLHPDAIYTFMPTGQSAGFMHQFAARGMDKQGIRVVSTGDVTDDDQLNQMGDVALGMVTAYFYSAAHDSPLNREFVAGYRAATAGNRPNMFAVAGYDGMHLIYAALEKTKGNSDGTALVDAMKGQAWESPRGPMSIDPQTRDVVQNIYIRKVERVDGELYNVEFKTYRDVKDPAKEK